MEDSIKCQKCNGTAEYLWKDGEDRIPVCEDCAGKQLLEEAINDNNIIEIQDLDDEELEELKKVK